MKTIGKLLLVTFVLIFFSCQRTQTNEIEKIINEVQDEFAPDSRTAIFDILMKKVPVKIFLKVKQILHRRKWHFLKK